MWAAGVARNAAGACILDLVGSGGTRKLSFRFNDAVEVRPKSARMRLEVHDFDLKTLRPVGAAEYAQARGYPDIGFCRQLAWEGVIRGSRAVIPASVLLASLLRVDGNSHWRLPPVLGRLALNGLPVDGLGVLHGHSEPLPLTLPWTKLPVTLGLEERLSWLCGFPGGRSLWASISSYAQQGWLGFDLPSARVCAELLAWHADDTAYVASLRLRTLSPAEEPHADVPFLSGCRFYPELAFGPNALSAADVVATERLQWARLSATAERLGSLGARGEAQARAEVETALGIPKGCSTCQLHEADWSRLRRMMKALGARGIARAA